MSGLDWTGLDFFYVVCMCGCVYVCMYVCFMRVMYSRASVYTVFPFITQYQLNCAQRNVRMGI